MIRARMGFPGRSRGEALSRLKFARKWNSWRIDQCMDDESMVKEEWLRRGAVGSALTRRRVWL